MSVAAPVGGTIADRMSRRTFMLLNDGVRLVLVVVAALCIYGGAPAVVVLVLGILVGVVGSSFRAAQAGLIPLLAEDPQQLTASNATAEILESIGLFVGPALGGLLLGFFAIEWVVLFDGLTFVWSMALVYGVRRVERAAPHDDQGGRPGPRQGLVRPRDVGRLHRAGQGRGHAVVHRSGRAERSAERCSHRAAGPDRGGLLRVGLRGRLPQRHGRGRNRPGRLRDAGARRSGPPGPCDGRRTPRLVAATRGHGPGSGESCCWC